MSKSIFLVTLTTKHADIALNSDNIPIIIEEAKDSDFVFAEKKTFVNFRIDWDCFNALSESMFAELTSPFAQLKVSASSDRSCDEPESSVSALVGLNN